MDVQELMVSWGLESLYSKFEVNGIKSLEILKEISVEDVSDLMTIGERAVFRAKFVPWKILSEQNNVLVEFQDEFSGEIIRQSASVENTKDPKYQSRQGSAILKCTPTKKSPLPNSSRQFDRSSPCVSIPQSPTQHSPQPKRPRNSTIASNLFSESTSSSSSVVSVPTVKPSFNSVQITTASDVEKLLVSSLAGYAILAAYKSNKRLNEKSRNKIASILISNELQVSDNFKIPAEKLQLLSNALEKLFPTVLSTVWYVPYVNLGFKEKVTARGKLYDSYQNERRNLRSVGLLPSTDKKVPVITLDESDDDQLCIHAFKLLSILLPTKPIKGSVKSWECKNKELLCKKIFLCVNDDNDLDAEIVAKSEELEEYGLNLQPLIAVVREGTLRMNIYVCINKTKYLVKCPIEAIDLCFKSCWVLNAYYPVESLLAFTYLQKYLYKIKDTYKIKNKSDVIYSSLSKLEEKLRLDTSY